MSEGGRETQEVPVLSERYWQLTAGGEEAVFFRDVGPWSSRWYHTHTYTGNTKLAIFKEKEEVVKESGGR